MEVHDPPMQEIIFIDSEVIIEIGTKNNDIIPIIYNKINGHVDTKQYC